MRIATFCVLLIGCGSSDPETPATATDSGTTTDTNTPTDSATTDSAVAMDTPEDTAASLKVKSITLKVDGTAVTVGTDVVREYSKNNVKWTIGKPAAMLGMAQFYLVLDIGAVSKKPSDPSFATADVQFKTLTIFRGNPGGEASYSSLGTTGFKDTATVDTAAGTLDYTATGTEKFLSGGGGGPATFTIDLAITGAPLR